MNGASSGPRLKSERRRFYESKALPYATIETGNFGRPG
jgi:hypothetical protein